MGRLTYEKENGAWGLNNYDIRKVPKELYGAICKLHEYEKSGLTPGQLLEIDQMYAEKCRKVAELKGRLADMPGV